MQGVRVQLSQKPKAFSESFPAFWQSAQNFLHFEKKDQLSNLNILEVIDSEKYGCLNPRKLLFQKPLGESTCSRVLNTAETTVATLLSKLSIDPRHNELKNISVSEISKVRTVW